jgi:hypothetical protein
MPDNADPMPEPTSNRLPPRLARRLGESPSRRRSLILYGVIAVLVIAGLLLPPISLFDRMFKPCGELAVGGDAQSAQHPDGLAVLPARAEQAYRLTLSAISQADFKSGAAGETLIAARDALSVNLMLVSPVYQIEACGDEPQPATLSVAVPPGAQPENTLDLYAWDSEQRQWSWIGSSHDVTHGAVLATTDALPEAVALMQTTSVSPAIGIEVAPGEKISGDVSGIAGEIYPTGLVIAPDGSLGGDRASLPEASSPAQVAYPIVRNYLAGGRPNPDLVRGVLDVAEARQAHIDTLTALAVEDDYAGVMLDYQGLIETDREAYADFVSDLAPALHAQDRQLAVVLPEPLFTPEGMADTTGYDWTRIGRAADMVLSPMSDAAIVAWATTQVDRYKLRPILSALSVQSVDGPEMPVTFAEAIEMLGVVSAGDVVSVTADTPVTFTLQAKFPIDNFAYNPAAGVYTYEYVDKSNATHRVVVATVAALAEELAGVLPLHTRGVALRGVTGDTSPRLGEVLRAYRQQSPPKFESEIEILWQIQPEKGEPSTLSKPLSESWLAWRAPSEPGTYRVSATIAGVDLGAVDVAVSAGSPEEEVAAVTAGFGSGGGSASGDGTPGAEAGGCYDAAYVADVSVPDGTRFDKDKEFTKTWKVRNNGACAWAADTELAFISGSQLSAPSTVKVGVLEPGKEIEISVPMKTSGADGNFTGVWQLRNKDGFYGDSLTVVIGAGEQTAVAPVGNIGSFEAGAHIDGFQRPDLMKHAGLKWVKIQTYAGVDVSGAINNAHAQGFKILLGIVGDKERVMDGVYQDEYTAAVAAMAAAGADAIEVWNEPNINREWPTGQVNGANYTALLAKAYRAIKAANPGTLVVSGALAPTGFWGAAGCSPDGCNDDTFLAQMAAAGAAGYMDCIGAHHNAGATPPSASSGHPGGPHYSWYFLPTLNLYYNSFGGARKVCFTELGYLSDDGYPSLESTAPAFAWASNVTVGQQAAWLAEAAAMSARSGKVRLMIIWNADFTRYDSDPMAGYAMIRPGGSCPACDALRNVLGGR